MFGNLTNKFFDDIPVRNKLFNQCKEILVAEYINRLYGGEPIYFTRDASDEEVQIAAFISNEDQYQAYLTQVNKLCTQIQEWVRNNLFLYDSDFRQLPNLFTFETRGTSTRQTDENNDSLLVITTSHEYGKKLFEELCYELEHGTAYIEQKTMWMIDWSKLLNSDPSKIFGLLSSIIPKLSLENSCPIAYHLLVVEIEWIAKNLLQVQHKDYKTNPLIISLIINTFFNFIAKDYGLPLRRDPRIKFGHETVVNMVSEKLEEFKAGVATFFRSFKESCDTLNLLKFCINKIESHARQSTDLEQFKTELDAYWGEDKLFSVELISDLNTADDGKKPQLKESVLRKHLKVTMLRRFAGNNWLPPETLAIKSIVNPTVRGTQKIAVINCVNFSVKPSWYWCEVILHQSASTIILDCSGDDLRNAKENIMTRNYFQILVALKEHVFENTIFEKFDFSYIDLTHVHFKNCTFISPVLNGTTLSNTRFNMSVTFSDCAFIATNFNKSNLSHLDLTRVNFSDCQFKDINLEQTILSENSFNGIHETGVNNFRGAQFQFEKFLGDMSSDAESMIGNFTLKFFKDNAHNDSLLEERPGQLGKYILHHLYGGNEPVYFVRKPKKSAETQIEEFTYTQPQYNTYLSQINALCTKIQEWVTKEIPAELREKFKNLINLFTFEIKSNKDKKEYLIGHNPNEIIETHIVAKEILEKLCYELEHGTADISQKRALMTEWSTPLGLCNAGILSSMVQIEKKLSSAKPVDIMGIISSFIEDFATTLFDAKYAYFNVGQGNQRHVVDALFNLVASDLCLPKRVDFHLIRNDTNMYRLLYAIYKEFYHSVKNISVVNFIERLIETIEQQAHQTTDPEQFITGLDNCFGRDELFSIESIFYIEITDSDKKHQLKESVLRGHLQTTILRRFVANGWLLQNTLTTELIVDPTVRGAQKTAAVNCVTFSLEPNWGWCEVKYQQKKLNMTSVTTIPNCFVSDLATAEKNIMTRNSFQILLALRVHDFNDTVFDGVDFSDMDLSEVIFEKCHFKQIKLDRTKLYDAEFSSSARLSDCIFENTTFNQSDLSNLDMVSVTFENCRFINVEFNKIKLSNLENNLFAQLSNCTFTDTVFNQSDLSNFDLTSVTFINCRFINIKLYQAALSAENFDQMYNDGQRDFRNTLLKFNNFENKNLTDVDLLDCEIKIDWLKNCVLNHQIYHFLRLRGTREFEGCSIFGDADEPFHFSNCQLVDCDFQNVTLSTISFDYLYHTLSYRDFSMFNLHRVNFSRLDYSTIKLEECDFTNTCYVHWPLKYIKLATGNPMKTCISLLKDYGNASSMVCRLQRYGQTHTLTVAEKLSVLVEKANDYKTIQEIYNDTFTVPTSLAPAGTLYKIFNLCLILNNEEFVIPNVSQSSVSPTATASM